jgi:hypothetical protein
MYGEEMTIVNNLRAGLSSGPLQKIRSTSAIEPKTLQDALKFKQHYFEKFDPKSRTKNHEKNSSTELSVNSITL